jgi:glycerol-3-phosphate dehydrogenase
VTLVRRPEALGEGRFDVLVVGAGVLGAFTAWDAALRGLSVALVEQGDFAGGTSSNSLKIVHGGARYLARGDVARMRASSVERSVWLRIAPHLVEPLPVLAPFDRGFPGSRLLLRAGVLASELATRDRNADVPDDRLVPPARLLGRERCLELFPAFAGTALSGGVLFQDALMYSSERLVLELVTAAAEAGAAVANRVRCEGPLREGGRRVGVLATDLSTGETLPVRAAAVVNTAGDRAASLTRRLLDREVARSSVPSLAINVVLEGSMGARVGAGAAPALALPEGGGVRGRRFLLVPWRGRTLLGTAHVPWTDSSGPPAIDADHPAVHRFLDDFNAAWPGDPVEADQVLLVHAGLLPARPRRPPRGADGAEAGTPPRVPREAGGVELTRHSRVTVHGEGEGTPVIEGETVKFTTARRVAEELVDRACWIVGHETSGSRTAVTPLPGAPAAQTAVLLASARVELEGVLPDDVIEHLVRTYGARYRAVVDGYRRDPGWRRRVQPDAPVIRAQLLHGVASEMASTADDLLFRRTELGARGGLTAEAHAEAEAVVSRREHAAGHPLRPRAAGIVEAEAREPLAAGGVAPTEARTTDSIEPPAPRPALATWLVDGHAHYHPCFGWERFLLGTVRNLSRAAAARREPVAAGCLLLARGASDPTLEELAHGRHHPSGWRADPTEEVGSIILQRGDGLPLVLVEGRQVETTEGVEVLALCRAGPVPDGRPLEETLEAILEGDGVPVLPWGFGKWSGRRGGIVAAMMSRLASDGLGPSGAARVFLGDNGNRPGLWPAHRHLQSAPEAGILVLPGSDPLPFGHHAERAGSFGFRLTGALELARPAASIRATLVSLGGSPPPFGERVGMAEFILSQVGMQMRKRTGPRDGSAKAANGP